MILRSLLASALLFAAACTVDSEADNQTPAPDAAQGGGGGGGDGSGNGGGGGDEADAGTSSGPLPFLAECNPADDQCDAADGLVCFNFNSRGPHCTRSCDGPDDCEAPSTGCNNMGVCKAP